MSPASEPFEIRSARREDVPALGELGARLVRQHHALDAERFFLPREPIASSYGRFLGSQLGDADALVLAATRAGHVVGYAYATFEERNWELLLDRSGVLHDLYVDEDARRTGIGRALVDEVVRRVRARGLRRLVLSTAWRNERAQRTFESLGFRRTMLELTRELE